MKDKMSEKLVNTGISSIYRYVFIYSFNMNLTKRLKRGVGVRRYPDPGTGLPLQIPKIQRGCAHEYQ